MSTFDGEYVKDVQTQGTYAISAFVLVADGHYSQTDAMLPRLPILHQAVASDTGLVYTWSALGYDAGAGYPGTGTPTNIVVIVGMGTG